jgi:hypothetical protein
MVLVVNHDARYSNFHAVSFIATQKSAWSCCVTTRGALLRLESTGFQQAKVNTRNDVWLHLAFSRKMTQMRPVEFGEALASGSQLTLFSEDKPDRFFRVLKYWIDETSGIALALKTGVPSYQVEDEEGRMHLLLHLPIEEKNEDRGASGGRTRRALIRGRFLRGRWLRNRKGLTYRPSPVLGKDLQEPAVFAHAPQRFYAGDGLGQSKPIEILSAHILSSWINY